MYTSPQTCLPRMQTTFLLEVLYFRLPNGPNVCSATSFLQSTLGRRGLRSVTLVHGFYLTLKSSAVPKARSTILVRTWSPTLGPGTHFKTQVHTMKLFGAFGSSSQTPLACNVEPKLRGMGYLTCSFTLRLRY